jgi:hypothetical protein
LTGRYEMKWYTSSSLVAARSSDMKGSGRANELCALRSSSQLEMARPLSSGGNSLVNALKAVSSSPRSSVGRLSRIARIACVAQALEIICCAKKR